MTDITVLDYYSIQADNHSVNNKLYCSKKTQFIINEYST